METKILYVPVERGQPRVPVVSREEWEAIFSEYPSAERGYVANLAAHNWNVVMIDGRIVVSSAHSGGKWIDKDGTRTPLTPEEIDAFYPRGGDRYGWPKFTYDQSSKCYRQTTFVLPAARAALGKEV